MSIKINPLKNVSNTNVLRGDGSNPLYDLLRVHPDQAGAVRDTHLPVLVADEAHHVRHTGGAELRLYRTAGHLGRRVLEVCRTVQVLYSTATVLDSSSYPFREVRQVPAVSGLAV